MAEKFKAKDLVDRLRSKFTIDNGYLVLEQVANGTGYTKRSSWIDVAVFAVWPSLGLTRSGYEVKVDRQDFLSELQNPSKNQWVRESFHEFWFVAPKDVAKEEELPAGCGLMVPHGKGLRIVRHAPRKADPVLNDSLMAAFMRNAVKAGDKFSIADFKAKMRGDIDFKQAKSWQEAGEEFLKQRGSLRYHDDKDKILQALTNATLDKQAVRDRDHIMSVLNDFQDQSLELLETQAMISLYSIMAADDLGHKVVQTWRGKDVDSVKSLTAKIKALKHHERHRKGALKHKVAMMELLEAIVEQSVL